MSLKNSTMNEIQKKADEIFFILSQANPEPKTELEYSNEYTLLVAVVLSAQATDIGVNKATKKLFQVADNPHDMLALGLDGLKEYIKTIGLYNSKAKNIISLSEDLLNKFDGKVPNNMDDLQKLAGVGRKTANVVMNCLWGAETIAVDTHVFRVANRLGLSKSQNPAKCEKDLLQNIPKKWLHHAHHWLILQGRYVCKARNPLCSICSIENLCEFSRNQNSANVARVSKKSS
jgi:endonuclease-3